MSSIRCHTVPQFYLKYFLAPNSNLFWVYDKKGASFREQPPVNTAVIGDYYLSSPDEQGNKDQRMEEFFSTLEAAAKPILDKWILNPMEWEEEGKSLIAMFLSFMHTRVPRTVETIKEIAAAGVSCAIDKIKDSAKDIGKMKELYENYCASEKGKDCKGSFEEYLKLMSDPLKYASIYIDEKYAVGNSFLTSEKIYRILMSMHWSIGASNDSHFFVTNDAPLNIYVPTNNSRAIFGGGIILPKAEVSFPLSPKLCLQIRHTPIKRYHRIYADSIDEINRRSIYMAERYVISPFKSNRICKEFKKFSGTYGKPKIDAELIKQKLKREGIGDNL